MTGLKVSPKPTGRRANRNREVTLDEVFKSAMDIIISSGIEDIRFEQVAARTGVSRTLLNHYFHDRSGFFDFILGRVLMNFKSHVDSAVETMTRPSDIIVAYVKSHFEWVRKNPAETIALLSFFPKCLVSDSYRALNESSVEIGLRRIERMLHYFIDEQRSIPRLARTFQILLTGAVVSYATESSLQEGASSREYEKVVFDLLRANGINL